MKSRKAFIFDLDGVIVDTAKYHFLAWKNLASSLGINFTETQNEQLKGVSRIKSLEKILEMGNKTISEDKFQELLISKNEEYLDYVHQMDTNEILPGVLDILDFLDAHNIPYALGSASKNAPLILEKVGLRERFSAIVDGNDVSKGKPDPEVFLIGAKKLKTAPEDCVVFEDAVAGIQAAKNAKMTAVGIGDATILYEADYVFRNMADISTDVLKRLID